MKTNSMLVRVFVVVWLSQIVTASRADHLLLGGARAHQTRSEFPEYIPEKNDVSYLIAYEYHEDPAFWQLAAGFTPNPGNSNTVDYLITPEINLLFKDRMVRGGVGILKPYARGKDGMESKWQDLYWQFLLGVSIPLPGRLTIDLYGFYPFESWNRLDNFEFEDIEYGGYLGFRF